MRQKAEIIGRHYASQRGRSWFSDETFVAMARLRGINCNAAEGMAEAFYARKIVFRVLNAAQLRSRPLMTVIGSGQVMRNATSS